MRAPAQAAVIFTLLITWMGLGIFKEREQEADGETAFVAPALDSVRVLTLQAKDFRRPVLVRASTFAERNVPITARITAVVTDVPVFEGTRVEEGDLLCQLEEEDKRASLVEAEGQMKTAEVDWQATSRLVAQNLTSELDISRKEASLKNASARLERAQLQLQYTQIQAPFAGLLDEIPAEIGGVLVQGQTCARLLDLDPILVRGYIAEAEVDYIASNDPVEVQLSTGTTAIGQLSFVSRSADEASRTFRVEARIPNPNLDIRHGLSADLLVFSHSQLAHQIPASSLLLDATVGVVVKILDDTDTVRQMAVEILYDDSDGIWVAGLPDKVRLITIGHYYVSPGQVVAGVETEDVALGLEGGALPPIISNSALSPSRNNHVLPPTTSNRARSSANSNEQ